MYPSQVFFSFLSIPANEIESSDCGIGSSWDDLQISEKQLKNMREKIVEGYCIWFSLGTRNLKFGVAMRDARCLPESLEFTCLIHTDRWFRKWGWVRSDSKCTPYTRHKHGI